VLDKSGLHRMKLIALRKTFDGRDSTTVQGHCKSQAGNDTDSIGEHRARATLAMIASFF